MDCRVGQLLRLGAARVRNERGNERESEGEKAVSGQTEDGRHGRSGQWVTVGPWGQCWKVGVHRVTCGGAAVGLRAIWSRSQNTKTGRFDGQIWHKTTARKLTDVV